MLEFRWGLHVICILIYEHGSSYSLLMSCSISLLKDLNILLYAPFTDFIGVTPKLFTLFSTIVYSIVSLTCFSGCLSFVYMKAAAFVSYFCIQLLYSKCLTKIPQCNF